MNGATDTGRSDDGHRAYPAPGAYVIPAPQ
jgi:hypothetical protein